MSKSGIEGDVLGQSKNTEQAERDAAARRRTLTGLLEQLARRSSAELAERVDDETAHVDTVAQLVELASLLGLEAELDELAAGARAGSAVDDETARKRQQQLRDARHRIGLDEPAPSRPVWGQAKD